MRETSPLVTIGIVTRNRPQSLHDCLESLAVLGDRLAEVIVVDDTSDVPCETAFEHLPPLVSGKLRTIRQLRLEGCIVARNTMMREAKTEYVMLIDDDAALLEGDSIAHALRLLDEHPDVAGVACAMAERDGSPWHPSTQPAPVDYTCYVPTFIGFAHILRRSHFTQLAGYRESFHFYGEEKDYCLRALDAGFNIVYMPAARVVHAPDPSTRDRSKYVRYVVRNDCLFALHNEPLPLALATVPVRLSRYFRMARGFNDPGGFTWIVRDLLKQLPAIFRERRPVSWNTIRHWRRVSRTWPAFPLVRTHA